MSTFDEIQRSIEKDIENKREQDAGQPMPVPSKTSELPVDNNGMPDVEAKQSGIIGTMVARPGTENVLIDATTFQLMECISSAQGREKKRSCIVEKGVYAKYGNQFINSKGFRTHVVTRDVFRLFTGVLNNVTKQLRTKTSDLERVTEQRDLYKMTIDALKKNGVID